MLVTYEGEDPDKVFEITKELTNFYLIYNKEDRSRLANQAVDSIDSEIELQAKYIEELKERIDQFKKEHSEYLPENYSMNRRMVESLELQLSKLDVEILRAKEKKLKLESNIDPEIKNLQNLKFELTTKASVLSPKHPDIIQAVSVIVS